MELLPAKATFAPGEPIVVEARQLGAPARVALVHLADVVAEANASPRDPFARFEPQPEGGYGVDAPGAHTAVDVLRDPLARVRYGFVSEFGRGRSADGFSDNVRRLHLNAVQFYDWMYRHARLLPPGDDYEDPLGRPLSLSVVRALVDTTRAAGAVPLAYAAVYAAGRDDWPAWRGHGLYRADGEPWTLGENFLWIVDPTADEWRRHFAAELQAAASLGFGGFHLDQYGAPKWAQRLDGTVVDLADAFPRLIEHVARELPTSRLIFNNVNDFPTWTTARAPQAATYIEVWPPHTRLADLARLVERARALAPDRAVVLAAYPRAVEPHSLLLATAFSHGATVLLHGEERAVLTEAYYVRHGELDASAYEATRRYYDFAVRYGDLFFDRTAADVTYSYVGGQNEEIRIDAPVPVAHRAEPGALWVRVTRTQHGLFVNLIDLSTQDDDLWAAPKNPSRPLGGVRIAVERAGERRVFFATPDEPLLRPAAAERDARDDVIEVPPFATWAIVWFAAGA